MIRVALPKGRIAEQTLDIFQKIFNEKFEFESRKLILKKAGFTFLNVRNWDVATYVYHGAADIGIVGYDVIKELRSEVLELLDMKLGICKVCIGGIVGDDSYKNKNTECGKNTQRQEVILFKSFPKNCWNWQKTIRYSVGILNKISIKTWNSITKDYVGTPMSNKNVSQNYET